MEKLLIFAFVVVLVLAAAVIVYTAITNKIIEDQDEEIEILKRDNERLKLLVGHLENSKLKASNGKVNQDEPSITFKIVNPAAGKVLEDLFKDW